MTSRPSRTNFGVIVENIDSTITEDVLQIVFAKYGEINSVSIPDSSKSKGYVNFRNKEDAEQAVSGLNNNYVNGRQLKVILQPWIDFRLLTDCQYKEMCTKKDVCFSVFDSFCFINSSIAMASVYVF